MKLKNKILFPIIGVTALSASVTPVLVGCNNKAEKQTYVVHVRDVGDSYSDWHIYIAEEDANFEIKVDKNKDVTVSTKWQPNEAASDFGIDKLYAYSKRILVDGEEIPASLSADVPGYHIVAEENNSLTIKVDKECFKKQYDDENKPLIEFELAFAEDQIDQNVNLNTFTEKHFKVGDEDFDSLHSEPININVPEGDVVSVEMSANLNNWHKGENGNKIPKTNYIYLALVNNGNIVPIQETGTVYLGVKALVSHIVDGYMIIEAPKDEDGKFIGWGEEGDLQPIRLYMDFYHSYEGIEFALAEPYANVTSVDSVITNSNDYLLDWQPEFVNTKPYFNTNANGDYVTTIKWNPQGFAERLYAAKKVIRIAGQDVPEADGGNPGYVVLDDEESNNFFTITIPASFMKVDESGHINLEMELFMNESYIIDDSLLQNWNASLPIEGLGDCAALSSETMSISARDVINFQAPLWLWGKGLDSNEGEYVPTNAFFLLGLWDDDENELIPITRTGTVYYGSEELDTVIVDGYMLIYAPKNGWGELGSLKDIHMYMEFNYNHPNAHLTLLQPNNAATAYKVSSTYESGSLIAEPTFSYDKLISFDTDTNYEVTVHWEPEGIMFDYLANSGYTVSTVQNDQVHEMQENKEYYVTRYKVDQNWKTFAFPKSGLQGLNPEIKFHFYLDEPTLDHDSVLDTWSDDMCGYTGIYSSYKFSPDPRILGYSYIGFQVRLGVFKSLPDEIHLACFNGSETATPEKVNISEIYRPGNTKVYYGQQQIDAHISNGEIIIPKPSAGWGEIPGVLSGSIRFVNEYEDLIFVAGTPKA